MSFHAWWTCGFGSTGASSGVGAEGVRQVTLEYCCGYGHIGSWGGGGDSYLYRFGVEVFI